VPARARLRAGRPVWLAGRGRQRGRPVAGAGGRVAGAAPPGLVPAPTTTPRTATVMTVWIPRGPLSRLSVESTVLDPAAHPDNRTGILGTGSLGAWAPAGPRSTARTGRGGGRTAEGSSCRAAPATQVGSGTTSRGLPLRRRRALPPGAARPRVGGDGLGGHRRAGRGEPSDPAPGPRQPPADRQRPGRRCGQPTGLPARLVRPAPRTPRTQPAGGAPPVGPSVMTEGTVNPGAADFVVTFSAGHSTRCRLRAQFPVELLEGGRLAGPCRATAPPPRSTGTCPKVTASIRASPGPGWGATGAGAGTSASGSAAPAARSFPPGPCSGRPAPTPASHRPWSRPRCPSGQTANELGRVPFEHVSVLWLVLAARPTQRTSSCLPPTTRHSSSACCPATPTSTSSPAAVSTSGGIKGAGACSSATRPVRWSASTWLAGCSPGCDGLAGERRGADLASRR
jgi:hypothetical protein